MGPKLRCQKCGKPYERGGKRFEKHVAECDGTPWKARVPRRPRGRSRGERPPEVDSGLGGLERVIADCNNRRLELERMKELVKEQITLIDHEIQVISKIVESLRQARRE